MTEQVKKTRSEIVQKFCRTILWIDDDIHLCDGVKNGVDALPTLFRDKLVEFEGNGLLCHLKGFPKVLAGKKSDPYAKAKTAEDAIKSCVALAQQADVVMIDWKLGDADSSQHAQKIISQLLGPDKGFRIIVVLSQDAPADSAFQGLDESFKAMPGDGSRWQNGSGQFLLSLRKNQFTDHNLFDSISEALLDAYPDYLHLAALEIAGRIKDVVPQWFTAITPKADMGVLLERGNTMKDDDKWCENLQECITSNLMDDLSTVVLKPGFSSLSADVLKPSNNPLLRFPECEGDVKNVLSGLKACVRDESPVEFSMRDYKKLFSFQADKDIQGIVQGIESFTEFCERRSCMPKNADPVPGAVYTELTEEHCKIAVCVSGGCDCLRSSSLMFLIGKELTGCDVPWYEAKDDETYRGGKTILRFAGKAYVFCGQASSMISMPIETVRAKKPIGIFRHDILNRLVSRYMYQIRRVAVNQPMLSRSLRGEKKDES